MRGEALPPTASSARDRLKALVVALRRMRDADTLFIRRTVVSICEYADAIHTSGPPASVLYVERSAGQQAHLWLEYLTGSILSGDMARQLADVNPTLGPAQTDMIRTGLVALMLRVNRMAQANRCITLANTLVASVASAIRAADATVGSAGPSESGMGQPDTRQQVLDQLLTVEMESKALADQLRAPRCYATADEPPAPPEDPAVASASDSEDASPPASEPEVPADVPMDENATPSKEPPPILELHPVTITFDPRFLVFEYVFGFLLKCRQVDLVQEMAEAAAQGRSRVNQMIMGSGKTTVGSRMLLSFYERSL
jgi:hypothetical protein